MSRDHADVGVEEGADAVRAIMDAAKRFQAPAMEPEPITDDAMPPEPPPMAEPEQAELPLVRYSAWDMLAAPPPPRCWHVDGWIPGDNVTGIFGDGGEGKTQLAAQLGYCTAVEGVNYLGMPIRHGAVGILTAEESRDEFSFRLHQIADHIAVSDDARRHPFEIVSRDTEDATLCNFPKGVIEPTPLYRQLVEMIADMNMCLAIIDAAADVFGGDENDRQQVRAFIAMLRKPAIQHKCAVALIGHPSREGMRSGLGYSGSTAWNNGVRARQYLTTPKDKDGEDTDNNLRCLSLNKTNRGKRGQKIMLRLDDGFFSLASGMASNTKKIGEAKIKFLELLALFNRRGMEVSNRKGSTYAPKLFADDPKGKGFTSELFGAAMNALIDDSKLRADEYGPPSKRRVRLIEVSA